MTKNITVLFDLDGTLINSNEIIIKSYFHAFEVFLPNISLTRDKVISFIGPTLENVFSRYVSEEKIKPMIMTYRDYYTKHEKEYHSLYPGVIEGLTSLRELGIKSAIVTSKFKSAAWPSYIHYGLNQYFDAFIALEDVSAPKPNKEPVLKGLAACGPYDYAIMIGDSPGDIQSGLNAGIEGAGVAWSIQGIERLNEANPDVIFHSMNDIVNYIKEKKAA